MGLLDIDIDIKMESQREPHAPWVKGSSSYDVAETSLRHNTAFNFANVIKLYV
jgi:hypothetical protein